MIKLIILGEPKGLEARAEYIFIGWLGLLNQPLPQLFLILMLYDLILVTSDFFLRLQLENANPLNIVDSK
jgi:hypothetical protein